MVKKQTNPAHDPLYLWDQNRDGLWCPSCGEMVAARYKFDDPDFEAPDYCKACRYPDHQ